MPGSRLVLAIVTLLYTGAFGARAVVNGNREFILYILVMTLVGVVVFIADRRAKFPVWILWLLSLWGVMHMAGGLIRVDADLFGAAPPPAALEHLPPQADSADLETETRSVQGGRPALYGLWLLPNRTLRFDQFVHCYGFFVATWMCWFSLRRFLAPREAKHNLALYIVVWCAGMGLGAGNEVVEFLATIIFDKTGVGGYLNNSLDLVFNMAGSLFAILCVYARERFYVRPGEI